MWSSTDWYSSGTYTETRCGGNHLNLSNVAKSKPPALVGSTSMAQHQSVAAAGTTAASGWTTLRLASSSRYSHPSPSTPQVRAHNRWACATKTRPSALVGANGYFTMRHS